MQATIVTSTHGKTTRRGRTVGFKAPEDGDGAAEAVGDDERDAAGGRGPEDGVEGLRGAALVRLGLLEERFGRWVRRSGLTRLATALPEGAVGASRARSTTGRTPWGPSRRTRSWCSMLARTVARSS